MQITYRDIKRTLSHENIKGYVKEGMYYSKAVIGLSQKKIVDIFFLYYYDIKTDIVCPPFARIAVDSENKTLAYYNDIREKQFNCTMPDNFVSNIPYDNVYKKWENVYEDCYCRIRDFAFEHTLTNTQQSILKEYDQSFDYIIDKEIKPYYIELSPEFWEWMGKVINL